MRLDFNVLWVDDQPTRVRAQNQPIARHMEAQGFEFKPTYCQTMDEVRTLISSDLFNDEVDLILVDWDLGGEEKGQDAIVAIREHIRYKDVIFYSAQTSPDELRNLVHEAGIEGVFCAGRDDLVDEVVDVFDSLVKKVLDLDHTRGIVMGATSDIDFMVNECLRHAHGKLNDEGKKALIVQALKLIDKRLKDVARRVEKLRKATTLDPLFDSHLIFTANDRLRMLAGVLKIEVFKPHEGRRGAVLSYMETIVPDRNILGHQIPELGEGPKKILNSKGDAIGIDEARELRRSILGLRSDFRALLAALQVTS